MFIARTPEMLKVLVAHGGDVNSKDVQTSDDTLLQHLAGADRMRLVQDVLAYGADVDAVNHRGQTAAHTAAQFSRPSMLKQLIEYGADMNVRDQWGFTPLMYAVQVLGDSPNRSHGMEVVELLAAQPGVDFAQKTNDGKSMIQLAKRNDPLKRLLRASKITSGIDAAMTDKDKPSTSSVSHAGPSL
jgi:ankyrin repeat protein